LDAAPAGCAIAATMLQPGTQLMHLPARAG
jgi:hypothetical protein